MTGVRAVRLIESEAISLIKSQEVHPDIRLVLASVLFADGEGVSTYSKGQLQRWMASHGRRRASAWFVQARIDVLIEQGVLAPGSTPLELRSMVAYGQEEGQ